MADPFTIIGTTSAVISFVQFAGGIIAIAYSLYGSTVESTVENAQLEGVTSKMNELLNSLRTEPASRAQSSQETSIYELAAICQGLGEKVLTLLKKTKMKQAHSMRESIRVAMTTVWTRSVVNELREDMRSCTAQLGLHLQAIMRY
jgi:hypothetical protein